MSNRINSTLFLWSMRRKKRRSLSLPKGLVHKRGAGLDDIYCRLNAVNLFTAAKPKEMRGPYEKPDELDKIASEINSELLY